MSEHEQPPPARVEVWRQGRDAWRWRFVEDGTEDATPLQLMSSTVEPSEEAAVVAAALAYPGVPVQVRDAGDGRPADSEPSDRHPWMWRGATAALTIALVAAALRYRRWWVAPAAPFLAHGIVSRLRRSLP